MSTPRRTLLVLLLLGAAARVVSFLLKPPLHPDEIFQYLEPAWWHLHGYGWPAWEWGIGLRSWVLPGYHGAWMALLGLAGIHGGAAIHAFLQLHWAALTLLMIPAALRASGLYAGVLVALWPELVDFAPHTLTEVPSAILIVLGIAAWIRARTLEGTEEQRAIALASALLSFAVCLRLPNGPIALVPALDLLVRRRFPALGALVLAASGPLLFFGAVDLATWGRPFHSMLAFLDYNFLQGRAAEHGRSPLYDYAAMLWSRTSGTILIVLAAALFEWRRTWTTAGPALLLVVLLSTQAHKEERFLLAAWALFALGWGTAMEGRRPAVAWVLTAAVLGGTLIGVSRRPPLDYTFQAGLYDSESWVGAQRDVTGLLVEGPIYMGGGFFRFSRNLPLETFQPALLANRIFNYAAVADGRAEESWCKQAGFQRVFGTRGWSVWKRAAGPAPLGVR